MGDACGPKVVVVGFLGGFELSETKPARASCFGEQAGAVGRSAAREVRLARAWDRCSKA